jgi:enoyl-[acyl-carrier protein] reductase II
MIRTALCELLGIAHPIIQAGMGPFAPASLAAAVSNAGGLGSIGTFGLDPIKLVRPADDLERQFSSVRELTDRPFAINFVVPYFEERRALFNRGLKIHPKLVSFALGDPGALIERTHDAGALVMLQVTTVRQAEHAAARGVDVIVAQGGESGGPPQRAPNKKRTLTARDGAKHCTRTRVSWISYINTGKRSLHRHHLRRSLSPYR